MKLYEITNGYTGYSYVRVYVVADNEKKAIELAREKFKEEAEDRIAYNEKYYNNLEAEVMCENVCQEWVSEVLD